MKRNSVLIAVSTIILSGLISAVAVAQSAEVSRDCSRREAYLRQQAAKEILEVQEAAYVRANRFLDQLETKEGIYERYVASIKTEGDRAYRQCRFEGGSQERCTSLKRLILLQLRDLAQRFGAFARGIDRKVTRVLLALRQRVASLNERLEQAIQQLHQECNF